MEPRKSINAFVKQRDLKKSTEAFHSEVTILRKKPPELSQKYKNNWYMKHADEEDPHFSLHEVIAQEFIRLILPAHPKTRLIIDEYGNCCVISKEVPGYHDLYKIPQEILKKNIHTGVYTGIGEIVVMALVVNEIDLKWPNLCLNNKNQILKLDGDRCFVRLDSFFAKEANYDITSDEIAALPSINKYSAYHWMDMVADEKRRKSEIFDKDFDQSPQFRDEVNRTILKVCVLPENLLKEFVSHYLPDDEKNKKLLTEELIARCQQLKNAALQNDAFKKYVTSVLAKRELVKFIEHLKAFKTIGKAGLTINDGVDLQFAELRLAAGGQSKYETRLFAKIQQASTAGKKPNSQNSQQLRLR